MALNESLNEIQFHWYINKKGWLIELNKFNGSDSIKNLLIIYLLKLISYEIDSIYWSSNAEIELECVNLL